MVSRDLSSGFTTLLVDRHPAAPFVLAATCLALTLAVGLRFAAGRPRPALAT
jgi:hypothetical protein